MKGQIIFHWPHWNLFKEHPMHNFPHRYFRWTNLHKKISVQKFRFRFINIICHFIKEWRFSVVRIQVFVGLYRFLCTHISMYEVSLSFYKCELDEKTLFICKHSFETSCVVESIYKQTTSTTSQIINFLHFPLFNSFFKTCVIFSKPEWTDLYLTYREP